MAKTPGISRKDMLRRIGDALGRKEPSEAPEPPAVDESLVRLAEETGDVPALFVEQAEKIGLAVRRCGAGELTDHLVELLRQIEARSVTLAVDRLDEAEALTEAVRAAGIELGEWRGDRGMDAHYEADAGVTDVHAALAETGSLVCNSDAAHGRGGSLAPADHIAIVRRSDIVADMVDYVRRIEGVEPADLPSAQAIITGPSKTADIEGVLITGVHGPGRVTVLLVEDR